MKDSHKLQVASHKMRNSRKLQVSSLKSQGSHAMVAGGVACFNCLFTATISRKKITEFEKSPLRLATCDYARGVLCS
jgi:hypothetical protein